jgi:hypothetical protein
VIPDILQFPLALFWGLALLLVLFRRRLGASWKIGALLLYVFYVIWFREAILQAWQGFHEQFGVSLFAMLDALWQEVGRTLMLVWPVFLLMVFFLASDRSASWILRMLVVLTLFYWLFFFLFRSLPEGWARPYQEKLPQKLEIPSLPEIEGVETDL